MAHRISAGGSYKIDRKLTQLQLSGVLSRASALVFGDLNDPESQVSRLSRSPRGTKLLEDIGTHPKVTYLQKGF